MKLTSLIVHRIILGMLFFSWSLVTAASKNNNYYYVDYEVNLQPATKTAQVAINLRKNAQFIRSIRLKVDSQRYLNFKGSGQVKVKEDFVLWQPNGKPGSLTYTVKMNHQRKSGRYDSIITDSWALFRGFDIIPQLRVDMQDGTQSKAKLLFKMPKSWSIATPYIRYTSGAYKVDHPKSAFDRPKGWIVAGDIGVKRETIKGIKVAVGAPKKQSARRLDILAMLNWNLPVFLDIFPDFPKRINIVSANDPMWRGALSGPSSLFLHADRPLITEDGTSPPIHELIHVAMSARAEPGHDWLVEGLAEYYSLEIMRRSGTITQERFEKSIKEQVSRGKKISKLKVARSYGPITAKAVGILYKVDQEIRQRTHNKASLDNVIRALANPNIAITLQEAQKITEKLVGAPLESLQNIR
ncbi:hypothetical protein H0A36_14375 [Endozoicomonas sp. SM1973]|uniref:Uncharacterized protein n=1 Tax=Spartinivicinus marinus TaxID=2994442 RepID=A0A853HZQ0_9GAMM|nr:hypothetical protein [Spartinivicinus marinus]MCX4028533.1 hypothetical protein [Spartinivicinus marinus]NYZ67200.1 hypothetical protein [Spartinivicinus marinus]